MTNWIDNGRATRQHDSVGDELGGDVGGDDMAVG